MKKILTGIGLQITGALLVLSALVSASIVSMNLGSWITNLGKFWTAMLESKLIILFVIGLVLLIVGMVISLREAFFKSEG